MRRKARDAASAASSTEAKSTSTFHRTPTLGSFLSFNSGQTTVPPVLVKTSDGVVRVGGDLGYVVGTSKRADDSAGPDATADIDEGVDDLYDVALVGTPARGDSAQGERRRLTLLFMLLSFAHVAVLVGAYVYYELLILKKNEPYAVVLVSDARPTLQFVSSLAVGVAGILAVLSRHPHLLTLWCVGAPMVFLCSFGSVPYFGYAGHFIFDFALWSIALQLREKLSPSFVVVREHRNY